MFFYILRKWEDNSYSDYFKDINLHCNTEFSDALVLKKYHNEYIDLRKQNVGNI